MFMKRLAPAALACGLLLSLAANPASAAPSDSVQMSVDVISPSLSISVNPTTQTLNFGDMTKGSTSQLSSTFQVEVTDAATTSQMTDGWKVMMQPSNLTSGANTVALGSSKTTTVSTLQYKPSAGSITWSAGAGTAGSTQPVLVNTTTQTMLTTGSYYFFRASGANGSKGTWTGVVPSNYFELALATNQPTGTYTGTLTLTVSRGL